MRMARLTQSLAGQRLGKDILTPTGKVLLRAGVVLTAGYITELMRRGFTSVFVEDMLVPDIIINDAIKEETRVKTVSLIKQVAVKSLNEKSIDLAPVKKAIDNIIDEVTSARATVYNLAVLRNVDSYTYEHSVNVAVLAIILGASVYLTYDNLKTLGVGAVMHDLGKVYIPEIINKPGRLSPEEIEIMKTHTWLGFNVLHKSGETDLLSAHIALQHHERLDGSGYPRGLRGNEIIKFAKIAAVADVYDALNADRIYRPKLPPDEIMEIMTAMKGNHLEAELVNKLFTHVSLYPTGTLVLLTTGEIGVVSQQGSDGLSPMVRILTDPDQNLIEPFEIQLSPPFKVKRILENYPQRVIEQIQQMTSRELLRHVG